MRSDVRDLRQLQLLRPRALGERTSSGCAVFEGPGAASALGAVAFSWRMHFRARAALAGLSAVVVVCITDAGPIKSGLRVSQRRATDSAAPFLHGAHEIVKHLTLQFAKFNFPNNYL